MQLGNYVKKKRKQLGLRQLDFAYQLQITPSYLNDIEHNRREPSDEVLQRLVGALGLNLDYAFYLIDKYPLDLRGNKSEDKVKRAFMLLRGK